MRFVEIASRMDEKGSPGCAQSLVTPGEPPGRRAVWMGRASNQAGSSLYPNQLFTRHKISLCHAWLIRCTLKHLARAMGEPLADSGNDPTFKSHSAQLFFFFNKKELLIFNILETAGCLFLGFVCSSVLPGVF